MDSAKEEFFNELPYADMVVEEEKHMLEFKKITEFPRGTLYDILQDAYSFDKRNMG